MIAVFKPLNIGEHLLKRLGLHTCFRETWVTAGRFNGSPTTQHETHAEFVGDFKQNIARLRATIGMIRIMVIGTCGGAGQQQFS